MVGMIRQKIGMIGAGQMATALAQGFLKAGLVSAAQLSAADPLADARERFAQATGIGAVAGNAEVAARAAVVFLAVKPQQIDAVLDELRGALAGKLVISIAAGVKLARLAERLGGAARLVRVMPNTPCLVGQGASAFCLGGGATADDAAVVEQLLQAVGTAFRVDEKLMDAVTGLSGSGPAFVYIMIEALSDGGVRMGLPRGIATALAAQTVLGAAQMVLTTGEHPAVLKDRVASPGGTTIAGLKALEDGGLRSAVIAAVEAAARRSAELG
jgi:pyrroline-5-carboxylate reductase